MYTANTRGTNIVVSGHLGKVPFPYMEGSVVQGDGSRPMQKKGTKTNKQRGNRHVSYNDIVISLFNKFWSPSYFLFDP